MQRKIYQYLDVTLTLSAVSINSSSDFSGITVTNNTINGIKFGKTSKKAFSIPITARGAGSLKVDRQPTTNDIRASVSKVMGTGLILENENIWTGTARSVDQTMDGDGSAITGTVMTMDVNCSTIMAVGDRVTGNAALDAKTYANAVTVTVVGTSGDAKDFTISESITIADNEELTFTPANYYRFDMGAVNILDLNNRNMIVGTNAITGSKLDNFTQTIDLEQPAVSQSTSTVVPTVVESEIFEEDRVPSEPSVTVTKVLVESNAIEYTTEKPTITDGIETARKGRITFNTQQSKDLEGDTVLFYANGKAAIKNLNGYEVELSNLKATLTELTTTTTADTSAIASTTVEVADRSGIMNNVTRIKGIGISPLVAYPTITAGGGSDGAGNLTTTAQALESGITLTLLGTGSVVTLTGDIEIKSFGNSSATLSFDIESFLSGS